LDRALKVKKSGLSGFTLMELLTVIAVISILMGMILTGGEKAKLKAKVYKTQAMISSIDTAVSMYHTDFGAYPPSGNQNLVNLLANSGVYGANPSWNGPYMSFKSDDLSGSIASGNATVTDAWGNDLYYNLEASPPPDYKIWSRGPDQGNDNGLDDDIISW
jgi:general secretion pathway protein G